MMRPRIPVWQRRLMRAEFNGQTPSQSAWKPGDPRGPGPRGLLDTPSRPPLHTRTPYDRPMVARHSQMKSQAGQDIETQKQVLEMIDLAQKQLQMEREKILHEMQQKEENDPKPIPSLMGRGRPEGPGGRKFSPSERPGLLGTRPDQTFPRSNVESESQMNGARQSMNGPRPLMGRDADGPRPLMGRDVDGPRPLMGRDVDGPRPLMGRDADGPRPLMGRDADGPRGAMSGSRGSGLGNAGHMGNTRQGIMGLAQNQREMNALHDLRAGGTMGNLQQGPRSGVSGMLNQQAPLDVPGTRGSLLQNPGMSRPQLPSSAPQRASQSFQGLGNSSDWRQSDWRRQQDVSSRDSSWQPRLGVPEWERTQSDWFRQDSLLGQGSADFRDRRLGDMQYDSFRDRYAADRIEDRRYQPLATTDSFSSSRSSLFSGRDFY